MRTPVVRGSSPIRRRVSSSLASAAFATAALIGAACGPSPSTSPPFSPVAVRSSPSPSATVTASRTAVVPSSRSSETQTDTAWGRIWDSLPAVFPTIPGSTPAEGGEGPVSATFAVNGNGANAITTGMKASLEAAGYRTEGLSGPLEDGSYVLDLAGTVPGCQVELSATPQGGITTVSVLYGAACPHE